MLAAPRILQHPGRQADYSNLYSSTQADGLTQMAVTPHFMYTTYITMLI